MIQYLEKLNERSIVLASGSLQRKTILNNLGVKFEVQVSAFEENLDKASMSPENYVMQTAKMKAFDVASKKPGRNLYIFEAFEDGYDMVIGSDTVIVHSNQIIEKPRDEAHAIETLTKLSNGSHHVYTGVALLFPKHDFCHTFFACTQVTFADLSHDLILAYVATGEPMNKAGAYGIQSMGSCLVKSIDGCYFTVMGFPAFKFSQELSSLLKERKISFD